MPIRERLVGDVTILELAGPLVVERFGTLKEQIRQLVQAGRRHVVLDLQHVPYIDSIGVSEIVRAHVILCNRGGRLRLLNVPRRVYQLLRITGLLAILESCDTEAAAVESFAADSDDTTRRT